MLNVFLTVDVEIWPSSWWDLNQNSFRKDFQRYIYGSTTRGDYGVPFQLKLLNEYDLKAVFLVETLFACEFGIEWLKEIVELIQDAGQEVQMHLHPEWIGRMTDSILPGKKARRLLDYSLDDQIFIIGIGKEKLQEAGVNRVTAFRAGGYSANTDTLTALAKNNLLFDTSYNPCIYGDLGGIAPEGFLHQPNKINGIYEFPVSVFQDRPNHYRHLQLGACSFSELSNMLYQAEQSQWDYLVIVSHGFELLNRAKNRVDPIVVRRFEKLLRFLADNRDKFRTGCFSKTELYDFDSNYQVEPIKSNSFRTFLRCVEQASRRVFQ